MPTGVRTRTILSHDNTLYNIVLVNAISNKGTAPDLIYDESVWGPSDTPDSGRGSTRMGWYMKK